VAKTPTPKAAQTDSGSGERSAAGTLQAQQAQDVEELAAAMPFNSAKPHEHGFGNGVAPIEGDTVQAASRLPCASTLSEGNTSDKTGSAAIEGLNATIDALEIKWLRITDRRDNCGNRFLTRHRGMRGQGFGSNSPAHLASDFSSRLARIPALVRGDRGTHGRLRPVRRTSPCRECQLPGALTHPQATLKDSHDDRCEEICSIQQ